MEYISVREAAQKWGLTARMINYYCTDGRIEGAQMVANVWLIPKNAVKPEDRRKGNRRKRADGNGGCDI